jgi:UrcA family protein
MTFLKTALVAAVALSAAAPVAMAEIVSNKNRVEVSTAGLDMNNARDAEVLLERIRKAAVTACRDTQTVVPRAELECRSRTVANTVSGLNINALGVAYVDAFGEPAVASRE